MKTLTEDFIGMPATAPFLCARPSAAENRSEVRRNGSCDTGTREPKVVRRRPDPHQGRALEKLGHAVEYLIDSRTILIDEPVTKSDSEAIDILMRLSRHVFSECEEIIPVMQRLRAWMAGAISRQAH